MRLAILGMLLISFFQAAHAEAEKNCQYLAGASAHDITGPMIGTIMNGYGSPDHRPHGIHMRLWSRSLVLQDSCTGQIVSLTVNDLGMIFSDLKQTILDRLEQEVPGQFSHRNLLLAATHTHSALGGYSHRTLYNIPTLGFHSEVYEAIVTGTVKSIIDAYHSMEPSRLFVNQGRLSGAGFNRSIAAYNSNPSWERDLYSAPVPETMTLLKVVKKSGQDLASFNWFAVHPVSLPLSGQMISGDNKGLAAYYLEKSVTQKQGQKGYVAGFLQGNSGDVSPYPISIDGYQHQKGWQRLEDSAQKQFQKAKVLHQEARQELAGPMKIVHTFIDLHTYGIDGQNGGKTCYGALGFAFAAGTENANPLALFEEGLPKQGASWPHLQLMPEDQSCHGEKKILLPTGRFNPSWTPHVLPFQIITIGSLAIIAAPFEITTMAGRRMKRLLRESIESLGIRYTVLSALANDYAHYVTTPEEYQAQHYEGGSTLFGIRTLEAYIEIYRKLMTQLKASEPFRVKKGYEALQRPWFKAGIELTLDSKPIYKNYGSLVVPLMSQYQHGEPITAKFWAGDPRHSQANKGNYFRIEKQSATSSDWQEVLNDHDHETRVHWEAAGLRQSQMVLTWLTSLSSQEDGVYRICHRGQAKGLWSGLQPYNTCSKPFALRRK
ncbi:neutral/alkaline non-lysosomal ceramidase N-terminal domain-containing protein [Pseudobacteriovorax antillogorgiicola]|uniref:Neutral ceramidase n=2 Tax=Pseudobacteriovorax antillogorgiicola TaxID=1513793 RepID=A0A1Y6B993_9BACT|nr:neutral/alkaline non-lysosomal ceramidase N-terminal domain-containing protein [Pseudobacteriovorax antillogorgiicola]TCS58510.1 neutral ceramidase [Pseudobacteriovorax antillogorgiicola]SME98120.1 neutral ceramidase [Pseudobacteriovorax antillogorgiicola]